MMSELTDLATSMEELLEEALVALSGSDDLAASQRLRDFAAGARAFHNATHRHGHDPEFCSCHPAHVPNIIADAERAADVVLATGNHVRARRILAGLDPIPV